MRNVTKNILSKAYDLILPYYGRITLRQLFYMLVSDGTLQNNTKDYRKLISIMTNARRGKYEPIYGEMFKPWCLADNTRPILEASMWENPKKFIETVKDAYRTDWWKDQDEYVVVWVEKDALRSLFQPICRDYGVPLIIGRGYGSVPLLDWADRRLQNGTNPVVIYFGDHDPSGINIEESASPYVEAGFERAAVTFEQAEEKPSIPVNTKDPRAAKYLEAYGDRRWELEALSPEELESILKESIEAHCDMAMLEESKQADKSIKDKLTVTY